MSGVRAGAFVEPGEAARPLARRLAGSASVLVGRRIVLTVLGATATAVVARAVDTRSFGQLSSALAAMFIAAAVSDFGFSLVLGRRLASEPGREGSLLRATLQVQLAWTVLPAAGLIALAVLSGVTSTRGLAILVVTPAVLVGATAGSRQVFLARFRTGRLAAIDLTTGVAQFVGTVAVVLGGGGAVGVAAVIAVTATVNALAVAVEARRMVDRGRPARSDRREVIGAAFPLGVASVLSTLYFSVDLVLLGLLVSEEQLGEYAAACKVLSLLVVLPGLLMSAALPALAASRAAGCEDVLAARLFHWLAVAGLPLCVGAAVFARPLVDIVFGPGYAGAVPLVRILCCAAGVALFANVLGTLLVARAAARPIVLQNSIALVGNVGGNLLLVPRYGVTASAWLTLATELVVAAGSLGALRGRLALAPLIRPTLRPALAVVAAGAVGVVLSGDVLVAVPAAAAVFVALVAVLGAWPEELRPAVSR